MTEQLEELKEKVIHKLYVDLNHLEGSELLDELVSQAHEAGVADGEKRIENFISESFYDLTSATVEDVLVALNERNTKNSDVSNDF